MIIKISKSDWKNIGEKMGWLKKAQWSGRSDEGPPDPEEGEKMENEDLELDFEEIDIPEFPGVYFTGTYTINYDYEFPVNEQDGDDTININRITINNDIECSFIDPGYECPLSDNMDKVKEGIKREILDPKNGFMLEYEIREDARSKQAHHDPDADRKNWID